MGIVYHVIPGVDSMNEVDKEYSTPSGSEEEEEEEEER
jgi:hypothetical protein